MKTTGLLSLALCMLVPLSGAGVPAADSPIDSLATGFATPPVVARPLGWWHWINGNVTKDGIAADLEAFQRAGLGGVQMFDVEVYLPPGPVRYGTDAWFEHVQFAIRKCAELGLEFHLMNTPGWSASGGPWVTPELSMKRLVWSEAPTAGGPVSLVLPRPDTKPFYGGRKLKQADFYREIAVLAVPAATARIDDLARKIAWAAKPVSRPTAPDRPGIPLGEVLNLTDRVDASGRLTTTLPAGEWTILRFGYTTTGKTNHPAVPEGHGLEIDKLDADAVAFQFEHAVGRIIREAGPLAGTTFNGLLFDSFEGGFQNWTATLPAKFSAAKGYDLVPWLPLLAGRVVGSTQTAEAVLWDFRDVIDDLIAENYFGTMHRLAAAHGIKVYAEAQGGPLNPMTANRHVDVPMNEFWTPESAGRASRIKMSTSAAAFYGRPLVAAEAFTSTPENGRFQNTPATLKRPGDYAFTTGINRFALHSLTHQPVTAAAPGFALGRYGAHFGRLNTWWPYADAWISYLSRAQFLLQQGRIAADVCLLVDEDLGYGLPSRVANSLPGYDYEVAIPAFLADMTVQDGCLVHPKAGRFRLLVTPEKTTAKGWVAQIATLRRLVDLVQAGATLAGDPPVAPAGLKDWRERAEFDRLVKQIWGGLDGKSMRSRTLGRGRVYAGAKPLAVLQAEHIAPDLAWNAAPDALRFIHRTTPEAEIYFVFNDSAEARSLTLEFRQAGRTPEIWDAVSGTHAPAPVFRPTLHGTAVPVQMGPWGSTFVIFRAPLPLRWVTAAKSVDLSFQALGPLAVGTAVQLDYSDGQHRTVAVPALPAPVAFVGPWEVEFKDGRGAPPHATLPELASWTTNTDPGIRFYSGTAVYTKTLELAVPAPGAVAILDLGTVADIARVFVNGHDAGVAWQPPFRVNVTPWLQPGPNVLAIHVADRWINRLIGDEAIPDTLTYQPKGVSKFTDGRLLKLPDWLYDPTKAGERRRSTFSTWKHYDANSPLQPAGLLGPVKLEWRERISTD